MDQPSTLDLNFSRVISSSGYETGHHVEVGGLGNKLFEIPSANSSDFLRRSTELK